MTTFPGSPKLLKGAIVGIDPFNPVASVIIFQYNPKGLSREIQAQTAGVVRQVLVSPGQAVEGGDPLFELDSES